MTFGCSLLYGEISTSWLFGSLNASDSLRPLLSGSPYHADCLQHFTTKLLSSIKHILCLCLFDKQSKATEIPFVTMNSTSRHLRWNDLSPSTPLLWKKRKRFKCFITY